MATNDNERLYLVSFGNSDQYILRDGAASKESELARIEAELNAFLRSKFPDETFAYFTTPHVKEITAEEMSRFEGYAPLDAAAIESIEKVLEREVREMEANRQLNDNSPFANVNPAAADIPNILG